MSKQTPQTPKDDKPVEPVQAYVFAVHGGPMVHLFTNAVFTADPKKVEVDTWVQAQIDAGKLKIADE